MASATATRCVSWRLAITAADSALSPSAHAVASAHKAYKLANHGKSANPNPSEIAHLQGAEDVLQCCSTFLIHRSELQTSAK